MFAVRDSAYRFGLEPLTANNSSGTHTRKRPCYPNGNGFASDSYFPFWQHMLERFDLVLFDFRNCGRNPFHAAEPHNYHRFARDNVAVHHTIKDA